MDPRLALSKQVELSLQALENRSQMVAGDSYLRGKVSHLETAFTMLNTLRTSMRIYATVRVNAVRKAARCEEIVGA